MKINIKNETLIKIISPIPTGFVTTALMLAAGFITDFGQIAAFFILLAVLPCFSVWYAVYSVKSNGKVFLSAVYNAAVLTIGYVCFGFSNWLKALFYFMWIFSWTLFPQCIYKMSLKKKKAKDTNPEKQDSAVGIFKFSVFFLALAKSLPIILVISLVGIVTVAHTVPRRYKFMYQSGSPEEATIEIIKLNRIFFEHVWDRENDLNYYEEDFEKYYNENYFTIICTVEDTKEFIRGLRMLECINRPIFEQQTDFSYDSDIDSAYSKYAVKITYPNGVVEVITSNGSVLASDPNVYIDEYIFDVDAFYAFLEDQRVSNRK